MNHFIHQFSSLLSELDQNETAHAQSDWPGLAYLQGSFAISSAEKDWIPLCVSKGHRFMQASTVIINLNFVSKVKGG